MPIPSKGFCGEAGQGDGWEMDEPDGGETGAPCGAVETVDDGRGVGGPEGTDD